VSSHLDKTYCFSPADRVKIAQPHMKGYVTIHKIVSSRRARLAGSRTFFRNGQSALDATFALLSALSPLHIDYIFDIRMSEAWPQNILQLWKEKALEIFAKYPQVHAVTVANGGSPLRLQILEWKEFFQKYGDRILGIFKTQEDAEEFFDTLRGYANKP
jgi:hypothetical protein